jgi:hypothetical protein
MEGLDLYFNKEYEMKKFCQILWEGITNLIVFGLIGSAISFYFQYTISKRERDFQIQKLKSAQAQTIMDDASILIMKRMFEMMRINWALNSDQVKNADILFKYYQDNSLSEWNTKALIYLYQMQRYFNPEITATFTSEIESMNTPTLRDDFEKTHNSTRDWLKCMEKVCNNNICTPKVCVHEKLSANQDIAKLTKNSVNFINKINIDYAATFMSD